MGLYRVKPYEKEATIEGEGPMVMTITVHFHDGGSETFACAQPTLIEGGDRVVVTVTPDADEA